MTGPSHPCVFDGPINGKSFLAYVREFLVPVLRPGNIMALDNLGATKAARSGQLSEPLEPD